MAEQVADRTPLHPSTPLHPNKLHGIQILRGIAALMIVLLHVGVTEVRYGTDGARLFESFSVGNAGVDIFFVISGFIMVYTAARRAGSAAEAGRFLAKRVVRIYPTYWVYCLIVLLAWLVVPEWVNSSADEPPNLLASFLLLPMEGFPLLLVAWTLEFEMIFYVVFAAAMTAGRRLLLPLIFGAFGLLVAAGLVFQPRYDPWQVLLSPLLTEFALGCALGAMHLRRMWPDGWLFVAAGALILIGEAAGVSWVAWFGLEDAALARPMTYGLAGGLLVHGMVAVEGRREVRFPSLALAIGDSSYSLYLSHILVLAAVGRLWEAAGLDVLHNGIFVVVLVGACVGWGLISFRFVEEPLVIGGRRLIAARRAPGERRLAW